MAKASSPTVALNRQIHRQTHNTDKFQVIVRHVAPKPRTLTYDELLRRGLDGLAF